MTSLELMRRIGAVGDDLVNEAAQDLPRRRRWMLPAACAACAVIAVAGIWLGVNSGEGNVPAQPVDPDLPILTLGEEMWGSMGFEGIEAYDISEYYSGAPDLPEELPAALPVFANHVPRDDLVTQEEKDAKIEQVQEFFESETVTIEVWGDLTPRVEFEPALTLPEEYHGAEQSAQRLQALGEYLLETYPQWFAWMENPTVNVQGGGYNIYAEQLYQLHVTDYGQSYEEELLGNAYRDMWLCISEEDDLYIVWVYWPDLTDVIGEYPIISAQEAQELLLEGKYASSVPYEVSGEEAIRRVELCYRNDRTATWIPYYRFWVEVPPFADVEKLGLNTYGAYYVPAVEGQYIANMPTYDGRFN